MTLEALMKKDPIFWRVFFNTVNKIDIEYKLDESKSATVYLSTVSYILAEFKPDKKECTDRTFLVMKIS